MSLHWHQVLGYEVDWGSIPAWFGSISTSGALLIAFSILRTDRTASQQEQARLIGCRLTTGIVDQRTLKVVAYAINKSTLPVTRPLFFMHRDGELDPFVVNTKFPETLMPDEEVIATTWIVAGKSYGGTFRFTDANGVTWQRDCLSYELYTRKPKKWTVVRWHPVWLA